VTFARLRWAWLALVAAGMTFFVLHVTVGVGGATLDDFTSTWVYDGLEVLALAAITARAVLVPSERTVWALLAVAVAFWTLGDISWTAIYDNNPPFPSFADSLYLAFYPAAYLALALLVRHRVSRFNSSVWLDGVAVSLAVSSIGAAVLLEVVIHGNQGKLVAQATNLAYPLGDIVLIAGVAGVYAVAGVRIGAAWAAIAGALTLSAIADSIYLYDSAVGSYKAGTILDALWPAALILLALAAWSTPGRRSAVRLEGRPLAATPLLCGLVALGVLLDSFVQHRNIVGVALASAAIVTVIARALVTFRENEQISEHMRTLAITDSLTGLGNRRKLVEDLDRSFEQPAFRQRVFVLFDMNGFKGYNDTFGHPAGDALLARVAAKLQEAVGATGSSYRLGGDEFCAMAEVQTSEIEGFLDRTTGALAESSESFAVSAAFGCVILPDEATETKEALRIADQRLYAQKYQMLIARAQPHAVLLQALEEREPALREHVGGVAELSLRLARALHLSGRELEELGLAAQLHDIGKLAIPDSVLSKPGPLDDDEIAFIRSHTVIGQRILDASPALNEVGKIVRSTHECWDETGYPDGLAGDTIPLAARIISVCDAYCAMTETRPHGVVRSPEEAREELRRLAGKQFDPALVDAFCALEPLPHGDHLADDEQRRRLQPSGQIRNRA
jgi:diguanylate cyclase (GGDEF)-like protein